MSTQPLAGKFPCHRGGPLGGSSESYPWKLTNASVAGTLKVNINTGYLNAALPTGMTDPDGATFTLGSTTYYWLKIVASFTGSADVITIVTTTSGVVPAGTAITSTGFTSFRLIGFATVSGSTVTPANYIRDNLNVISFGNLIYWSR